MTLESRLIELGRRLENFEIVEGITLPAPSFERSWGEEGTGVGGRSFPKSFLEFVTNVGAISAMDTAGGVAFFSPDEVRDHLSQEYAPLLLSVDETETVPFGVNGSGSYLLLAVDDSAVWKFNAHMHPVAKPIRIAGGFDEFLSGLADDWEAVLDRRPAPYSTT